MDDETIKKERGQNLLIFAVLMVVLVALAALVIDGGFSLSKRREAQNAADAGALAGANELCAGNAALAEPRAIEYVDKNGASAAPEDVTVTSDMVSVKATIPYDTFLAGIFGNDEVTITANASAGCYVPCEGTGVLPVAWACQPPAGVPNTNDCGIITGTVDIPGPLYVIMDTNKTGLDFNCKNPPNNDFQPDRLDCDIFPADPDNDGINDLMTGGNRSWLDLSGNAGAGDLKTWVIDGFPGDLKRHTWFGGQAGVADAIFQTVEDRRVINPIVILPVFDSYCLGLPDTMCPASYHTVPPDEVQDTIVVSGGTSQTYFHVISFSAFYITCVSAPPGDRVCPGKDAVWANNPSLAQSDYNKIKTIEGFFINDYFGTGACEGTDAGVHTIYLNH